MAGAVIVSYLKERGAHLCDLLKLFAGELAGELEVVSKAKLAPKEGE
jgi:hypothetical protein